MSYTPSQETNFNLRTYTVPNVGEVNFVLGGDGKRFTAVNPINNQTGVVLSPLIDWSDSDPEGVDAYLLLIGTSPNLSNPVIETIVFDATSYQITEDLDPNTTYYWKVIPGSEGVAPEPPPDGGEDSTQGDIDALQAWASVSDAGEVLTGWATTGMSLDPEPEGVTVEDDRVVAIDIQGKGVTGELPEALGNLKKCKYLNIKQNFFSGELPISIAFMDDLEDLYLAGTNYNASSNINFYFHPDYNDDTTNDFSGILPPEWSQMKSINLLELRRQPKITGFLPPEWGNLVTMQNLFFNRLSLSGGLPPEWGGANGYPGMALHRFMANRCGLVGILPASWESFDMRVFSISRNELGESVSSIVSINTSSGTIVVQNPVFTNGSLVTVGDVELNITSNAIVVSNGFQYSYTVHSGNDSDINLNDVIKIDESLWAVPDEWQAWYGIRLLSIRTNLLKGEFPIWLFNGDYPFLNSFSPATNQFTDELPNELLYNEVVPDLNFYILSNNNLTGLVPLGANQAYNMIIYDYSYNNFTGELRELNYPPRRYDENGNVVQEGFWRIRHLRFRGNSNLTGSILTQLPDQRDTQWLDFYDCDFTSADPQAFINLQTVYWREERDGSGNIIGAYQVNGHERKRVNIFGNRLTFKHFEPAIEPLANKVDKDGNPYPIEFNYLPQRPFGNSRIIEYTQGQQIIIDDFVEVAEHEGTNYQWYRNTGSGFQIISGETSVDLLILSASLDDEGEYELRITHNNPALDGVTLISRRITLQPEI